YKYFDTIDSTNTYCKTLAESKAKEGTLVISEEQTKGRGTKGRLWSSPKGSGLWFSIILRPKMSISNLGKIVIVTSSALCETFKSLNIDAKIKWPNDILVKGKKLCGILTEVKLEGDYIDYIVLGIGINVNIDYMDFNDNLKLTATSLKIELSKEISRGYVLGTFLNFFEKFYTEMLHSSSFEYFKIYKENSFVINKTVNIIKNNTIETVTVLDFDLDGFIIVKDSNGAIKKISSGEVSLRF
ncbi:MAG: biotin--[acetyl-CoA-carboxylase] ligase, partial [Clostridium perfringens]|nr:biotin--[acetyl-CoA-carboxylase] ligase [Clostridium perfringens]